MNKRNYNSFNRALVTFVLLLVTMATSAQTQVQRGIARMITRSVNDPVVPVAGVQVVVDGVANKASDNNGRFSLNIKVNQEQSYSLTDVRLPKGSKLMLASPSKKKKLFLDNNDLEVSLISKHEKDMVSKANYDKLREKYKTQTEKVFNLRNQLDEKLAELNESSKEYAIVKAKRDSVQNLLSLYYDDKINEQTLKDLQTIAEDLALTDYQSLDSIEAHIYNLKMEGDWQTISGVLIRLMGGNASAWLHAKLERRNQAAKDFAMGMEMIKEAIEAFKMQHFNDSVSYYYEILVKADSTNCDNLNAAGEWERKFMARYDKALLYHFNALKYASNDTLKAATLSFIGNVYEDKDEHKKAGEYYDEALVLMKHYTHYDYAPVMAKFYDNIGPMVHFA